MRVENTAKGLNGRGSILVTGKRFSLPYSVQTDLEKHLSSYPMGTGLSFGGKAPGE
jgi:hypothetical protein